MINQSAIALSENGWPTCPKCGSILHWNSDFMAPELGLVDEEDVEQDDVINCLSCPDCNTDYYYRQTDNGMELTDVSTYPSFCP